MRVMANVDRLMLLCKHSLGEKSVGELEGSLGIRQPTLSQQLTILRQMASWLLDGKAKMFFIASLVNLYWL